jgi:hypothetical protein
MAFYIAVLNFKEIADYVTFLTTVHFDCRSVHRRKQNYFSLHYRIGNTSNIFIPTHFLLVLGIHLSRRRINP